MKSDADFARDFARSLPVVWRVGSWLLSRGMDVYMRPPRMRPTALSRMTFRDDGDLLVLRDGAFLRVEVKRRSLAFTSAASYPYPTVFVDEEYKVNAHHANGLLAYVVVAADGSHVAIIRAETRAQWVVRERHDPAQGRAARFVECPVPLVRFCDMSESREMRRAA